MYKFFERFWSVMFCVWSVIFVVDLFSGRYASGDGAMIVAALAMHEISKLKVGKDVG